MTEQRLRTFARLRGPLDDRIHMSTGLSSQAEILNAMTSKQVRQSVDLLLPTACNQECLHCFFKETGGPGYIRTTDTVMDEVLDLMNQCNREKKAVTLYPREITTVPRLFPVLSEQGIDRVLTNGLLLNDDRILSSLKKSGITELMISLHGPKEPHMKLTGVTEKQYDATVSGIEKAVDQGFQVGAFCTTYADNVERLPELFRDAKSLGIREVKLLRLTPLGNAKDLPESFFIGREQIRNMLYLVDDERLRNPDLKISLFSTSFGPNFYSKNIFRYLAGQKAQWPYSTYPCPMIGQEFIGISLGSNKIYPCFEALSFPELQIGHINEKNEITITSPPLNKDVLQKNLTGICSKEACPSQPICLGGCRISAFAFAKKKAQPNPITAGMDACVTEIISSELN